MPIRTRFKRWAFERALPTGNSVNRCYGTVDGFTQRVLGGNALTVVLHADDMTTAPIQQRFALGAVRELKRVGWCL